MQTGLDGKVVLITGASGESTRPLRAISRQKARSLFCIMSLQAPCRGGCFGLLDREFHGRVRRVFFVMKDGRVYKNIEVMLDDRSQRVHGRGSGGIGISIGF